MVARVGSTSSVLTRVEVLDDVLRREEVKSLRTIKLDELEVLQGCESWPPES